MVEDDPDDTWQDAAWEAEQREHLAYELAHPVYDPQVQPDGTYRDAEAERRTDRALADAFETSAALAGRAETVTLDLDADVLAWLRDQFPDWQAEVNGLLRFFHATITAREAAFDPDGFEPGEMIPCPPDPKFA